METTMEVAMNPEKSTIRKETGKTATEPRAVNTTPEHRHEDMVYRAEFRLLLGVGTFALAAILGGFAFFYAELTAFRTAMDRQFAELRIAMEKEHADIRLTMEREHVAMLEKIYNRTDREHDDLLEELSQRIARPQS